MAGGGGVAVQSGAVRNGRGGRFVGAEQLTEQQAAFVAEYVANGGNGAGAARVAGYAEPGREAYRLIRKPHVLAAVRAELERSLAEGCAIGMQTLKRIARDEMQPASAQVAAAKALMEAGGFLGAGRLPPMDEDKPLIDMTHEELQRYVARAAAEIDAPPEPIDGQSEPIPPGIPPGSVVMDVDEQGNPRLPASESAV